MEPHHIDCPTPTLDEGASSQGSHAQQGHHLKETLVTIRIYYQNIDGVPQDTNGNVKLQSIHQWLQLIEADVFAFMEAGTCWDVVKYGNIYHREPEAGGKWHSRALGTIGLKSTPPNFSQEALIV